MLMVLACFYGISCAADVDTAKDSRLAQPVTIECVNTRLHVVLAQLDEKTGVAIRSGRDNRDWQVRDIPVTVCAKDMPLGKLLKTIATSTHLLLSKEQVGQTTIYRIWRDAKRRKELDDYFKAKDTANLAGIAWDWDAVCKLKDIPASDGSSDHQMEMDRNLAGLLSSLGPEGKNKVMQGGYVRCTLANTPESMHGYMNKILQGILVSFPSAPQTLTPGDTQRSGMTVYLDRDNKGELRLWFAAGVDFVTSETRSSGQKCIEVSPVTSYNAAQQKSVDRAERPAQPKMPTHQMPDGDWRELAGREAWDLPVLQTKVSLEVPKDKDAITCGGLLAALSKATGFAVVCEDFASHKRVPSPAGLFAKDTTIKAVLQALDRSSAGGMPQARFVWHINVKDKVILGTSDSWTSHHINLVSEGFLAYLMDKLSGDGVNLDDYLKIMALEKGQVDEWIRYAPDFAILDAYGHPSHREFWMLYDSLSPQQKAQAQTEAGLPMRDLQPAYMAYLLLCYNQSEADKAHHNPFMGSEPKEFPYDDQSVADLVMKVAKKMELRSRNSWSTGQGESQVTSTWPLGSFTVDTYEMTIEVTQNGETRALSLGGPTGLPFRSPEREKALGIKPAK